MQTQATMRVHEAPIRTLKIKDRPYQVLGRMRGGWNFSTSGGDVKWHHHFGQDFGRFLISSTYAYRMIHSTPSDFFAQEKWKPLFTRTRNVRRSFICHSQKGRTNPMSVGRWRDEDREAGTYNGISLSNKKNEVFILQQHGWTPTSSGQVKEDGWKQCIRHASVYVKFEEVQTNP